MHLPRRYPSLPISLSRALHAGDAAGVRLQITRFGPGVLESRRRRDHASPLHVALAVRPFNSAMVRLLLEIGADPNAADRRGERPLHHLAPGVHDDVVQDLLAAGADPGARDAHGVCALHGLARADALEPVLQALPDTPADIDALLITAASAGAERVLDALLARGANPSARQPKGARTSALIQAAASGHLGCVNRLLRAGADTRPVSRRRTALANAAAGGHLACMHALLEAGVPAGGTGGGEPPLLSAAKSGQDEAVALLLSHGADPVRSDARGTYPLQERPTPRHPGPSGC